MSATIFTVSEINKAVKQFLEGTMTFKNLHIQGELSNVTYYKSGHLYFTLKDDKSTVKCAIFKYLYKGVPSDLKEGDQVKIVGNASLYEQTGSYQIIADSLEKANKLGSLYEKLEETKKKYLEKGYFDSSIKKEFPRIPINIGAVTAETGAAIRDIINTTHKRYKNVNIYLYPTKVQGVGSAKEIEHAIDYFNKVNANGELDLDLLIVGRGGGSIEDLWAFNEEPVIEAIYRSELPIISAVGHEIDNLISDLVADRRAATPTQAAEILIPLKSDLIAELDSRKNTLNKFLQNKLNIMKKDIERQKESYYLRNFMTKITDKKMELIHKEAQLNKELKYKVEKFSEKFEIVKARFNRLDLQENIALKKNQLEVKESLLSKMITESILSEKRGIEYKKAIISKYSIDEILKQGYTLTRKNGKVVRSGKGLQKGDIIQTRFIDGEVESIIQE
ncbi:MAG: exodeoxyribonuclease VII large subunit [Leptotrichiaceae bacterium]|mgnify:FL=1|jgi:exodeoxyribonuclease VII large subunit|nr:exodeoxyribonuclease VII large subunit [Leptotrichiaceae bacterium]MBP6167332.1 exodeoxyribonuclease VII large subunit [Leptotrichiaceae bacterium]MBP7025996.1 exodeoxyribonuclease VII large subunit [Leptotrichiaceae bacterium]MBP8636425.1 exodeoxyribonuclease VII large subunit [Leptotrichiaceae bacterium]MBP9538226.1 exodeoxyribonuclease VII large subunit [Leptotrichiaceae bacterium]